MLRELLAGSVGGRAWGAGEGCTVLSQFYHIIRSGVYGVRRAAICFLNSTDMEKETDVFIPSLITRSDHLAEPGKKDG